MIAALLDVPDLAHHDCPELVLLQDIGPVSPLPFFQVVKVGHGLPPWGYLRSLVEKGLVRAVVGTSKRRGVHRFGLPGLFGGRQEGHGRKDCVASGA